MTRGLALVLVSAFVLLACGRDADTRRDAVALEQHVLPLLVEHRQDALLWVANRPGVTFLSGFSQVQGVPNVGPGVFRTFGPRGAVRLAQGGKMPMHLVVIGWLNLAALMTERAVVSLYLDRKLVTRSDVREGPFDMQPIVPADWFPNADEHVLEVVVSTVGSPDAWPPELSVALVHHVSWRVEP